MYKFLHKHKFGKIWIKQILNVNIDFFKNLNLKIIILFIKKCKFFFFYLIKINWLYFLQNPNLCSSKLIINVIKRIFFESRLILLELLLLFFFILLKNRFFDVMILMILLKGIKFQSTSKFYWWWNWTAPNITRTSSVNRKIWKRHFVVVIIIIIEFITPPSRRICL